MVTGVSYAKINLRTSARDEEDVCRLIGLLEDTGLFESVVVENEEVDLEAAAGLSMRGVYDSEAAARGVIREMEIEAGLDETTQERSITLDGPAGSLDPGELVARIRVPGRGASLEEAEQAVRRVTYDAGLIFEHLENLGLIHGNGHHIAQNLAENAVNLLRKRWIGPKATAPESAVSADGGVSGEEGTDAS